MRRLLARLDRLASTKDVAQIGAAIGREFSYALIAAVAALPEADLRKALAQLVAAELIFRRGEPPDATYVFKHALVQDASYASLVRSRRQQIHGEIARVLEAKYPEIGASEPEILAHHFTEAGLIVQALHYWRNAGERALERSAGAETIAHLRRGIAVLATLPDTPDRDRQELTFQLGLGMALQVTRGWNSRDADSVYERARALAQRVGDDRGRFQAAWGQWIGSNTRGDSDTARAKNTELFCIAGRLDDPALLLQAHHSAWATALWEPNLIAVREHAAKGLALYSQEEHRSHAFLYGGHDAAMCGHALSGLAEWLLGFPNRADRSVRQAVDLGEALSHPPSLVFGLFSATINAYFRRDIAAVLDCADRTISVAEEFHLPIFGPGARILRGWALVERNDAGQGLIELRRGLNAFVATNFKLYSGFLRNALVDSYLRVGNIDAGLIASQEVLDYITSSGDGSWHAEALRARGELLVAAARHDEGETVLHRAIKLAKEQGARSLELRAATSLARFWRDQGKHIEARDLLAPVHAWFTEGFDTADLKDAKALLDELS